MKSYIILFVLIIGLLGFNACKAIRGQAAPSARAKSKGAVISTEFGLMSHYSSRDANPSKSRTTASGIPLDDWAYTAAHKTLPLGSRVRVTNLENGRSAVVIITDRGPYIDLRIIDVTYGVAKELGFLGQGIVNCKVELIKVPEVKKSD